LLSKKSYKAMTDWIEIEGALPGKFKYGLASTWSEKDSSDTLEPLMGITAGLPITPRRAQP